MVGILIELAASWLLAWLFDKSNLGVLGFRPTANRLRYTVILFIIAAACAATAFFMRMAIAHEQLMLNPKAGAGLVFNGLWVNLKSVLFEELLCRGVLLYILIKKLGQRWGILISATAFGMLHWFNLGVFGNIPQMLILFAYTFSMGLVLAYAYARSASLYLPFAIHYGWNLTQNFIFPGGPFGNQLFIPEPGQPAVTVSVIESLLIFVLPPLAAVVLNYLAVRRYPKDALFSVSRH